MLHSISWGSYWSALLILLIIYYGYVALKYYSGQLFQKQGAQRNEDPETDDALLPEVRSLTDEITAYCQQAAQTNAVKPEIIYALQRIIKKYPSIINSAYQSSVSKLLRLECHDQCGLHLDEMELKQVWMVQV